MRSWEKVQNGKFFKLRTATLLVPVHVQFNAFYRQSEKYHGHMFDEMTEYAKRR